MAVEPLRKLRPVYTLKFFDDNWCEILNRTLDDVTFPNVEVALRKWANYHNELAAQGVVGIDPVFRPWSLTLEVQHVEV